MLKLHTPHQSRLPEYLFLFYFYGATYVTIEVFFRSQSHWTMFLLGALCGLIIGRMNERVSWEMPIWLQMLFGGAIVTALEFIWGLVLNVWLGLGLWDYSNMWGNVMGQICPLFALAWCGISGVAVVLDDYLKFWFFDEEEPKYKLWF